MSSPSSATSTSATNTGLRDLCCHSELDAHCLGATGGWKTAHYATHITLMDEGLEGGVHALWAVVGEAPELMTEVHKVDRG